MLSFTDRMRLEEAFEEADKNRDGYIDLSEMKRVLALNHVINDDDTLKAIFNTFDTNKDGKLDVEEYIKMYIYLKQNAL
jgi:Ca2+-binding EF-hand superfamily protein